MSNLIKQAIRARALQLVTDPIRAELLYAQLGSDFVSAQKEVYHKVVDEMLANKDLIKLDYELDGVRKSIFFQFRCNLYIQFGDVEHKFMYNEEKK